MYPQALQNLESAWLMFNVVGIQLLPASLMDVHTLGDMKL